MIAHAEWWEGTAEETCLLPHVRERDGEREREKEGEKEKGERSD